ncbi:MAG: transcriptional repressor [Oscillospiraceae bacterium]|jgi:Fur family peroxide stress response transcriptional regulator|nr:transcriptional repressor [Oscillospiraceae bacterium]
MTVKRKHSRKRDAILSIIRSTTVHPTAEWIYRELKPDYPDLSLGTVYRNISLLQDNGELQTVGIIDGEARYDGNTTEHTHFICEACGAVLDLPALAPHLDAETNAAREALGLIISRRRVMYYGKCPTCVANSKIDSQI